MADDVMTDFEFLAALRTTSEDQAPTLWWDLAVKQVEGGIELERFDGVMDEFLRRVMAHALTPPRESVGKTLSITFGPRLRPLLKGSRSAAGRTAAEARWRGHRLRDATDEDRARILEEHGYKVPGHWGKVMVPERDGLPLVVKGVDREGGQHYVYTADYHAGQAAKKFQRVSELHQAMPKLKSALSRDVAAGDDNAIVVDIMRRTGARVGDDGNNAGRLVRDHTYGASTVRAKHITVNPSGSVTIAYKGKDGVQQRHLIKDPVLAAAIAAKKAGKTGNDPLFPDATDASTKSYLREATGLPKVKNHDLRTYVANGLASSLVGKGRAPTTVKEYRKRRAEVGKAVAKQLGNTPAVTLSTYINPTVFAPWMESSGEAA